MLHFYKKFNDLHDIINFKTVKQTFGKKFFSYDEKYFSNYKNLENTKTCSLINKARVELVRKYKYNHVLDFGIGSGTFVKTFADKIFGFDINPIGVNWLKENQLYLNPFLENHDHINSWTLWDVFEHFENPIKFLQILKKEDFLFMSIPIFVSFTNLERSKHYKPNEHLFYFTHQGLIELLGKYNLMLIEYNNIETQIGRENINTYVFKKIK